MLVELANFAKYLSANGHVAGDQRLLTVTEAWRRAGHDLFSPYGDELFVAILPGLSADAAQAQVDAIAQTPGITGLFDAGVAQWRHGDTEQHLMLRAEESLRQQSGG